MPAEREPEPNAAADQEPAPSRQPRVGAALKTVLRQREIITVAIIIVTAFVFHLLTMSSEPGRWPSVFVQTSNLKSMLAPLAMTAIVAVGMLLVLICGGFDLSVGAVVALAGLVAGLTVKATGGNLFLTFAAGISVGVIVGLINGIVVTKFSVNPLIATLGMMSVARGLALAYVQKYGVVSGFPRNFLDFAWETHIWIKGGAIVLIAIAIAALGDVLLRNSRWLRQLYYIGGNQDAARLSGINVNLVRASTHRGVRSPGGPRGGLLRGPLLRGLSRGWRRDGVAGYRGLRDRWRELGRGAGHGSRSRPRLYPDVHHQQWVADLGREARLAAGRPRRGSDRRGYYRHVHRSAPLRKVRAGRRQYRWRHWAR